MAGVPVFSSSPINPNAPPNPFHASPSKSAVRYTPATLAANSNTKATTTPPLPQSGATPVPQPTCPPRQTDSPSPRTIPSPMTRPSQPLPTNLSKLSIPNNTNTISRSNPYTAPPIPLHQRHPSLYSPPHLNTTPVLTSATLPQYHTPPTPYTHSAPTSHHQHQQPDLSNPPGYQQSRCSFDDRPLSACSTPSPNNRAYYLNSDHKSRLSILDGQYHTEPSLSDEEETDPLSAGSKWMWETAVKWTKVAGKTLKEGEGEFWRRVGGDDMEK